MTTDRNGNQLTSKPALGATSVFSCDEEARLRSVDTGTNVTAFLYDAGGTRSHKSGSSGTTLYPNAYLTVRNGTVLTRHIDAGGQRASSVVADGVDERACWHHADHLGSTQYTTTQTGAVHEHYEHLPFGEQWISHASAMDPTAHRFGGRELDPETGLQYVGARYYDPRTTRWLSVDPALPEQMAGGMGVEAQGHRFMIVDDTSRLPFQTDAASRVYTNRVALDVTTFFGLSPSSTVEMSRVLGPGGQRHNNGALWFERMR